MLLQKTVRNANIPISTSHISHLQPERLNMRYLLGFALLLPVVVFAKDPPLPEALLNAKTAFVNNAGATEKDFDKFCKELKKWGRFELVLDRVNVDIIISIFTEPRSRGDISGMGAIRSAKWQTNIIRIRDGRNDDLLYWAGTGEYSKNPAILVSNLKHEMNRK
jgi:hypothetical protein